MAVAEKKGGRKVSRTYRPAANASSGERTLYFESLTSTGRENSNFASNDVLLEERRKGQSAPAKPVRCCG